MKRQASKAPKINTSLLFDSDQETQSDDDDDDVSNINLRIQYFAYRSKHVRYAVTPGGQRAIQT